MTKKPSTRALLEKISKENDDSPNAESHESAMAPLIGTGALAGAGIGLLGGMDLHSTQKDALKHLKSGVHGPIPEASAFSRGRTLATMAGGAALAGAAGYGMSRLLEDDDSEHTLVGQASVLPATLAGGAAGFGVGALGSPDSWRRDIDDPLWESTRKAHKKLVEQYGDDVVPPKWILHGGSVDPEYPRDPEMHQEFRKIIDENPQWRKKALRNARTAPYKSMGLKAGLTAAGALGGSYLTRKYVDTLSNRHKESSEKDDSPKTEYHESAALPMTVTGALAGAGIGYFGGGSSRQLKTQKDALKHLKSEAYGHILGDSVVSKGRIAANMVGGAALAGAAGYGVSRLLEDDDSEHTLAGQASVLPATLAGGVAGFGTGLIGAPPLLGRGY